MIKITNRTFGPIPLMIKSKRKVNSFTTLIIPGRGAGQNFRLIEDERITDDVIRAEGIHNLITTTEVAGRIE